MNMLPTLRKNSQVTLSALFVEHVKAAESDPVSA